MGLFLSVLVGFGSAAGKWFAVNARRSMCSFAVLSLGVLGFYCCQLMFHELSYSPLDGSLVFFLAGITAGLHPLAATAKLPVS